MLSISTCWNSTRHTEGAPMLEELLEFGFDRVELGHGIGISMMQGIQEVFDSGRVQFSSLHNFCPLPVEVLKPSPDCLLFTSHNEAERARAVRQTLQTIDFAVRVGAPNVVLHCGRVVMPPVTDQLIGMALAGKHLSKEYARLKMRAVRQREKIAPKFIERLKDCLKRIVEHAAERGVRLGLESRQAYEEIPSEGEFEELLEAFPAPTVGYWHDFGHVQIRHNLGFVDHAEWLGKIAPRLIGCHLHDFIWPGRDHQAPFSGGSVDYNALVSLLPKDMLFVWEMSPRRTREEIAGSLQLWKEKFGS